LAINGSWAITGFIKVNSTNAQNGKNRRAIFTILRHLRRASRGANGYIEFTLN